MSHELEGKSIEEIGAWLERSLELYVEQAVNSYVGEEVTEELVDGLRLKLIEGLEELRKVLKPPVKPPKVMCIGCGQLIKPLHAASEEPWRDSWSDAIVSKISAGYGSDYDMNEYLIGVCDNCVKHNVHLGRLILIKEGT